MDDERPTVLQVITGIDVGGAENHLLALCEGLVDRGFDVTVAHLRDDDELVPEFREAGCDVYSVGLSGDVGVAALARLVRHVREAEYDVLHGHLFHGTVYGAAAAALGGVPNFVVSKHNDHPFWDEQPYRTIHDASLRSVDRVLCLSDHVRSYLLETTRLDPDLAETVYYGLDPAPFDAVTDADRRSVRAEFVGAEQPLVGTIGRLTEQKDFPVLLRAFDLVLEDHPDAHLAIVGRGDDEDSLRTLAADLDLEDDVTFAGFRRDVPALMNAFDVFALPSRWEGFGVVFLEAMAAETPIVASNASAIPEVVGTDSDAAGLLEEPGDVEGFADALDRLLTDDALRTRLGSQGRDRLETRFAVDRMVDEVASIYRETLRT